MFKGSSGKIEYSWQSANNEFQHWKMHLMTLFKQLKVHEGLYFSAILYKVEGF